MLYSNLFLNTEVIRFNSHLGGVWVRWITEISLSKGVMPIWILSVLEHCWNPLCQLYDPVSTISFMRECISVPMNPGPLLIIRNNFPTNLSNFFNSKVQKYFYLLHLQTKTQHRHLLLFIIALHIPAAQDFFWRRCHCIFTYSHCIFHFIFVYLHTPCAWQPLDEVEGTKQIYFILQVSRRRIGR
jgi:hypothetical protein